MSGDELRFSVVALALALSFVLGFRLGAACVREYLEDLANERRTKKDGETKDKTNGPRSEP